MELDGVKLRYGEVSQKAQELAAAERGGAEDTAKGKLASVLQSFTGGADVPKLQTVLSGPCGRIQGDQLFRRPVRPGKRSRRAFYLRQASA